MEKWWGLGFARHISAKQRRHKKFASKLIYKTDRLQKEEKGDYLATRWPGRFAVDEFYPSQTYPDSSPNASGNWQSDTQS